LDIFQLQLNDEDFSVITQFQLQLLLTGITLSVGWIKKENATINLRIEIRCQKIQRRLDS